MKFKRIFLLICDSLGIGEADDAADYGDVGANTFLHVLENVDIKYPSLEKMGLLNLVGKSNIETNSYYTKAMPKAVGKDTLTGHLEIIGLRRSEPFKTFSENGFPEGLLKELENNIGRKIIGNSCECGAKILKRLGEEQIKTGNLIVYTSSDSVLKIAAHESFIPVPVLNEYCKIAREITSRDEWKVGRVIACPFTGKPGNFSFTNNRKEYSLKPESESILDNLKNAGYDVVTIGKIEDIFVESDITKSVKTKDNLDGINKILDAIDSDFNGLCFANLNDFDYKFGHKRDVKGYGEALKQFNNYIPLIQNNLKEDDLLIITAAYGCDPTYKGSNHTRENTPVLLFSKKFKKSGRLDDLNCFSDIASTIADNFDVPTTDVGESFLDKLV